MSYSKLSGIPGRLTRAWALRCNGVHDLDSNTYLRNRASFMLSRNFTSQVRQEEYDLVVLGGGPGGYVAAIKSAQLGLRTACVEKRGALGGTCLNVGCVPSKALLNISNKYEEAQSDYANMGINITGLNIDVAQLQKHKKKAIDSLTKGVEFLFRKNQVQYVKGAATLKSPTEVSVNGLDGSNSVLKAKNVILATGSEPSPLPGGRVVVDEKIILSSTGALDLNFVPQSMAVIGGGVIGLELGSVWQKLGCKVTVIEFLDRVLPPVDSEIAQAYMKILHRGGMNFKMSSKVVGIDVRENSAVIHTEAASGGDANSMEVDRVLVAVGRRPYTTGLGLEDLRIEKDKRGCVIVDDNYCVPNHENIRAIGDLVAGPMLAHKAEEEGIASVELIANIGEGHVNYNSIPSVVYTHPEISGVGKTEDELKKQGIKYKKGTFPFAANSRARAIGNTDGMVKILADEGTDKILGAWILGPEAGELISEIVLAIEYGASSEDLARTCHAHPTLSEAVKEACMATYDKAIHI